LADLEPTTIANLSKLAARYLMRTTITDFVLRREHVRFEGVGVDADREEVRVNCSIQIYEIKTGKLLDSAQFAAEQAANLGPEAAGRAGDDSLTKVTERLAADILKWLAAIRTL